MQNKNSQDKTDSPLWHKMAIKEVCRVLGTSSESGLSLAEVAARLKSYGYNRIREKTKKPVWRIFIDQFADFMILILIAAAFISGLMGEIIDTIAIVVIVLLNAVVGFIQEYRAREAITALNRLSTPHSRVIRGEVVEISSVELVPGDLVLLEAGNIIPADLRIISGSALSVDEASLSGESFSVEKNEKVIAHENGAITQKNRLYKGTRLVHGRGMAVVTETGMNTRLGEIAGMIREEEPQTPLQKRITLFGKRLSILILLICAGIFAAGILRDEPALSMFMIAVSLAVAAIPEALPAVITITLAIGARLMSAKNALIRSLPAVETLGSITCICSDKTGTLTLNAMTLEALYVAGKRHDISSSGEGSFEGALFRWMGQAMALNNDSMISAQGEMLGDPTETALYQGAIKIKVAPGEESALLPRVGELPFDSTRKMMTTIHQVKENFEKESLEKKGVPEAYRLFCKGAPEVILDRCSFQENAQLEFKKIFKEINAVFSDKDELKAAAADFARQGYRVIAFAFKRLEQMPSEVDFSLESDLVFLGFAVLMDPPRPEAFEAVRLCKSAGIVPVMITGDHPATARNIAGRLGIMSPEQINSLAPGSEEGGAADDFVITGSELLAMSVDDLKGYVKDVRVYARVSPEQKIDIVRALQGEGHYVAMTGDGVNDAPALTVAEIGVAMGVVGTDVAREASDMILMDDNFSTIVSAVKEGRRVYDNIRKFIRYILSGNFAEIFTLTLAPFFGMPIPLLPIQILWVNLMTDSLPALALSTEKAETYIMERSPRAPSESIFAKGLGEYVILMGIMIGALSLFTQKLFLDRESWQSIVFTVLSFSQLYQVFSLRSERNFVFKIGFFSNRWVIGATLLMALLQLAVIYMPFFNDIFKTTPLSAMELLYCIVAPASIFVLAEIIKFYLSKKHSI